MTTNFDEQVYQAVEERLIELDAEAEVFNKECWVALKYVCESRPGFDWANFDGGEITAEDAMQFLLEEFRWLDDEVSSKKPPQKKYIPTLYRSLKLRCRLLANLIPN